MCAREIALLLGLRGLFAEHNFGLTFIVKDDYASETSVEFVDGERVYVDKELAFYHALGFHKSSLLQAISPSTVWKSFNAWRAGHSTVMDTTTDGTIHGGVLVVASPTATESGEAEIIYEHLELNIGETIAEDAGAEMRLRKAIEAFGNSNANPNPDTNLNKEL